jgi:hypothetical protein
MGGLWIGWMENCFCRFLVIAVFSRHWRVNAGSHRSTADHAPGIDLRHGFFEKHGGVVAGRGAEEIAFSVLGDAGGIDVDEQRLGQTPGLRYPRLAGEIVDDRP